MLKSLAYITAFVSAYVANVYAAQLEDVIDEVNSSVVSIAVDTSDSLQSLGAGIIISPDGYVVTNAHVTEDAQKITVVTPDDEYFEADLIGSDTKTDIALLKVKKPLNLEPARFGDSDNIRVGNQVFAIGNPFGLGNSVSLGIISAKERDIEKGPYDNFIQTDASINQGNSGGPLFNLNGEVIGVNTAIFSTDGKNIGVGFATPANTVAWVVEQLKQNGRVMRGWLGIAVQKVRQRSTDGISVLVVESMAENSPATEAGLKVGDVIEALGEVPLNNPRIFSLEVAKITPGTVVPLTVKRDGKVLDLQVRIIETPTDSLKEINEDVSADTTRQTEKKLPNFAELNIDKYSISKAVYFSPLGLKVYYDDTAQEFVVVEVDAKSVASARGVKIGDRFSEINDAKVYGADDLEVRLKELSKEPIVIAFHNSTEHFSVTFKLDSSDE